LIWMLSFKCFGMLTFDINNYTQSIKGYAQGAKSFGQQIKQLEEMKQQTEHFALHTKQLVAQAKMQKDNLAPLKVNNIKKIYSQMGQMNVTLQEGKRGMARFQNLDNRYREMFGVAGSDPLPSEEENHAMQQHLKRNLETNRRAMDSLKVLNTYEVDQKTLENIDSQSFKAMGQMQALQSSNQLASMQVKELQELKMIMAQNLEMRTAALSEENTQRVIAHKRREEQMAKPLKITKAIKLPNLKGGKYK